MTNKTRCIVVGNPNSGKSTLFNALSGSHVTVGNWSGVTVDQKVASLTLGGKQIELTDLPGLIDLEAMHDGGMLDESISQQVIRQADYDCLINIVDAAFIERNLYLTMQLRELGVPMVLVLNKIDVLESRGQKIDTAKLSKQLGCPVLTVSSKTSGGLKPLLNWLETDLAELPQPEAFKVPLADEVESSLEHLGGARAEALLQLLQPESDAAQQALNRLHAADIDLREHLAEKRYTVIESVSQQVLSKPAEKLSLTDRWDKLILSPWAGVPFFLFVMYLTFMFAINVGASFIDFFDIMAGAIFVDGATELLTAIGSPDLITTLLAGGVGAGIQTVATFIPVVAFLYVALSILEISGYLARAGFVIEGVMQKIGLPGKAFVPLIVGFGCNVPSVTATRTLDSHRERIVVAMMAPFMSCGARLPVYALFVAAFFPENGQNVVFALYLVGIVAAILTGLLLRYTLLPGNASRGYMELPNYEIPSLKAIMNRTWQRTKQFVFGAGKTIVIVVTILSFVNSIGADGSFGNEDSENSVLSKAAQVVTPAFAPMGVQEDNWPATVGIVTGIFAKEAVVGTLNSLYSAAEGEEEAEGGVDLLQALNEALSTIPEALFGIAWDDPLGINIGDATDTETMAEDFGFETGTLTNIEARFVTSAAAFAYLLFVLLYTPCAAVLGAMAGEFGNRWTAFCAVYTFILAYMVAVLFYQVSQLAVNPAQSLAWIAGILAVAVVAIIYLRRVGRKPIQGVGDIPVSVQY